MVDVQEKVRQRLSEVGLVGRMWETLRRAGPQSKVEAVGYVALTVAAGYGVYSGVRYGSTALTKMKAWWRKPPPVVVASEMPVDEHIKESKAPGSSEMPAKIPSFQVSVGYTRSGKFAVIGSALRVDDFLVMPDHVRCAVEGDLELRSGGGATYTLTRDNVDKMETIDTDLVAFEPDARLFSALGMTKPTFLQTLPEGRGAFCQIVGCLSRGTTGYVRHSPVFGHVEYTGTTKKGYSGAGYTVGKNLVGIHTHGGTVNGGYDITFVWAMLKYFREKKPEALDSDTAKWLETQKKNKARFVVDSQWQDLDEVRIRVNGRYHIVARDAMVDAYGPDWSTAAEVVRPGYRDLEAADPSGEANRDSFGASSSADMSAPLDGLAGRLFSQKEEQFLKKLLHFHNELKAPLKPQNS